MKATMCTKYGPPEVCHYSFTQTLGTMVCEPYTSMK